MTSATLAMGDSFVDVPERLRVRLRQARPLVAQLARYAVVGGLGTAANAVIFLLLRIWWETLAANLVALVLSTVLSTEFNRRFTFRSASPVGRWRTYVQTGGTVVFYAFYSSSVLVALALLVDDPSPWTQAVAISAASAVGGIGRYLVLRFWVFDGPVRSHDPALRH